jgi:Xaa-Pro aminopeptidase
MGVRVEDMLVVTDGGCEVLTRWPADEITEVPLL